MSVNDVMMSQSKSQFHIVTHRRLNLNVKSRLKAHYVNAPRAQPRARHKPNEGLE